MASKLRLSALVACCIALCPYSGNPMAGEIYLPIPDTGRPADKEKPMASEPKAHAKATGPWFEARWQEKDTGTWHGEPYERFWDARARTRAEIARGAQAAQVVHIPTGELIENITRGPEAPGARPGEPAPAPPR